ncbi:MAG TPA: BamA/TamA family outer membrane protein, partial [Agriterribacter sp.]
MKKRIIHIIIVWVTVCLLAGCSSTRKLPAGEALYTGATIKIEDPAPRNKEKKKIKAELEALTRPLPNKTILGMPFKLWMYNLAGNPKKEKSIGGWLKYKVGEPPVLAGDVNLEWNVKVLQSTLENRGYFKAVVQGDSILKNKKTRVVYTVQTGNRYIINEVVFDKDSAVLQKTINVSSGKTLLKTGDPFNLETVKAERERIDAELKEKGFYYFDPDYLIIQADSTIGNNTVNLQVKIKPGTPQRARKAYTINDVYIFPGYRLSAQKADTLKSDAAFYKGYYVVDKGKTYKPLMFAQSMQFNPGDVYNRKDHNQSISRLVNLGVFKFVKNRFEPVEDPDSAKLDVYYYLTSLPKKSLRADINANTKSNNLTGSGITIGWRNRNTFRGGELLSVNATAGFEIQYSGQLKGFNTYRGGLEAQLTFPRFLIPFVTLDTRSGFVPKTNILVAYDILTKEKLYTMNSFRGEFGYAWKETASKEHQFNPIAINYVQPIRVTPLYESNAANNPSLQKAIEKQFIIGSNYNYNYNELTGNNGLKGLYFNGNADFSGNIAGLITGANTLNGKPKTIFGAQFSQYVKLETDLRYYVKLSSKNTWANRLIVGFGYPYGNSSELPFIKQFFVGGNNSIRAFRSRSLGPGTYKDMNTMNFIPDQSGDIKLEFNTELRAKLFSIVHGAVFV